MANKNKFVWLQGYPMTCIVHGQTEKGKSVEIYLPSEVIAGVAKYLNEHNQHVGHAVWHYENQDREFPCPLCNPNEVIS